MFRSGNNIFHIIICALFIYGCTDKKTYIQDQYELNKFVSENTIGKKEYNRIFYSCYDSLNMWSDNGLKSVRALSVYKWKLDSLLCFNQEQTRFLSCIEIQDNVNSDSSLDYIYFLYGAKIKDNWYFFTGATYTYWWNSASSLSEVNRSSNRLFFLFDYCQKLRVGTHRL